MKQNQVDSNSTVYIQLTNCLLENRWTQTVDWSHYKATWKIFRSKPKANLVAIAGLKLISKESDKDRLTQFGNFIFWCTPGLDYLELETKSQISAKRWQDKCMLRAVTIRWSHKIDVNNWNLSEMVHDGPIFLRVLISRLIIDSRSTVS